MCTLDQILKGVNVWHEDQSLAKEYKIFFRGVIESIADLEKAGYTRGYLNNDTLSTDGHIIKVVKTPSAKTPTYRQELIEMAPKILQKTAIPSGHLESERVDFLQTVNDISNSTPTGQTFKLLIHHPLLVLNRWNFQSLVQVLRSLNLTKSYGRTQNVDFTRMFGRKEDVDNISDDATRSFAKLYHEAKPGKYQPNAYGALLFAKDALVYIEDNSHYNKLDLFFPDMKIRLFHFLYERAILDYITECRYGLEYPLRGYLSSAACVGCAGFAAFSVLIEKFLDRHD